MSINTIKQIQSSTLSTEMNWDWSNQKDLAELKPPEVLMGVRRDIMQGDISREWCKWIVEQFIDDRFLQKECTFPFVYSEVSECLKLLFGMQYSYDERQEIAIHISNLVIERVGHINAEKKRRSGITKGIKESLLAIYGEQPRCWLTGYKFSQEALHNFTASKNEKLPLILPKYIDKYKPIGVIDRDICIEIDHLYPFSLGGDDSLDNFRLICGWANKVKSNHISGYSKGTRESPKNELHPKRYYYWALRLIGLRRKCEADGCDKTINNAELTVCSSIGPTKIINPISMKVVCREHDTLASRFIKREEYT